VKTHSDEETAMLAGDRGAP